MILDKLLKIEENWVVFFDLFSKNGNGDSIRPIAEELKKRRPDMKFFFCDKKKKRLKYIEMADEIITEKTLRFKYVCSKAKYIISPMGFPDGGKKRDGQIFVQTWHGSPIKKLYLSRDKNKKKYKKYARQFENTDVFTMQGQKTAELLQEALNLPEKCFLNCGLPRNDVLYKADDEFKTRLKQKLGLPLDKKIIFYCPTWKRYDYKTILPFDIDYLKRDLQDEYVLLIRSHVGLHQWVDENNNPVNIFDNEFVFNGGTYPEVTHLYLISDILISDYSSAIFDFALTRKPEILYIYDYEEYKNEFGLYFDYEKSLPFPKAKNQEELLVAIKNCNTDKDCCEKFVEQYLEYENGTATKQVVDYICGV